MSVCPVPVPFTELANTRATFPSILSSPDDDDDGGGGDGDDLL